MDNDKKDFSIQNHVNDLIIEALEAYGGCRKSAAKALGISIRCLTNKINKLKEIDKYDYYFYGDIEKRRVEHHGAKPKNPNKKIKGIRYNPNLEYKGLASNKQRLEYKDNPEKGLNIRRDIIYT